MTDPAADRTVHAQLLHGVEIVRYDRSGKWYKEWLGKRRHIKIAEAVRLATAPGANTYLGLPGGGSFDAKVRRLRAR